MKKQTVKAFATMSLIITLATVSAIISASAQSSDMKVVASVPFDFTIGRQVMPAGEYTVKRLSQNSRAILIQSADGSASRIVQPIPTQSAKEQEQGKLVFHRYGNQYFLSQIWSAGETVGNELRKSAAERELERSMSRSEHAKNAPQKEKVVLIARH